MSLRSLIVDDNGHFLAAARNLLERQGIDVVGVAATGGEAFELAEQLRPDVALVDIDLGEESGFDVARRLVEAADDGSVILISSYPEADFADLIAASPAAGFLSKSDLSAAQIFEIVGRMGEEGSSEPRET
jgi:DNA-binding NarL/FixJ family response regulator